MLKNVNVMKINSNIEHVLYKINMLSKRVNSLLILSLNQQCSLSSFLKKYQTLLNGINFELYSSLEISKIFYGLLAQINMFTRQNSEQIIEITENFLRIYYVLKIIDTLGKNQFVIVKPLSRRLIDVVILSNNINETLDSYFKEESYSSFFEIAEKCITNSTVELNRELLKQVILTFQNGCFDLVVNGLTSIIDDTLSKACNMSITSFPKRIGYLVNIFGSKRIVDDDINAIAVVFLTWNDSMRIFATNSDFSESEPKELNRHWVAHGGTRNIKTKLDCLKLINILYGMILITEYIKKISFDASLNMIKSK